MKKLFCLYFIIYSTSLLAATDEKLEKIPAELSVVNKEINSPLMKAPDCLNPNTQATSCSDVTDNFCKTLWDDKHEGNLVVFDGEIKSGTNKSNDFGFARVEDDNALIESVSNMPEDMKKALSPLIANLSKHLESSNKSTKWARDYSRIKQEINYALDDVLEVRFETKNPPLKVKTSEEWTVQQGLLYQAESRSINDELTKAKYAKRASWQRVEKVFPEVKANLIKTIDDLNIPLATKTRLKEKLASINLSLPLRDPTAVDSDSKCASTEINAFFSPTSNNFTMCAGYFNTFASSSALAFVIGHELSHAIDSENIARIDSENSDISKSLKKLIGSSNQTYKCDDWKEINKNLMKSMDDYKLKNMDPLETLYTCLRGEQKLEEMNAQKINQAVKQMVKITLGNYADSNNFSNLLQKSKIVNKITVPNENYYRPDNQLLGEQGFDYSKMRRTADPTEIFMQNFNCILEEEKLTKEQYEKSNKLLRSALFEKAITQTSTIMEVTKQDSLKYCGLNCAEITDSGMTTNPQEKAADWFSIQAFPAYLKTIPAANRAEASALATSLFCDSNSVGSSELKAAEKKFSLEVHADERIRRVSLYTPEISKSIGCKSDTTEKGYAQCKP